MKNRRYRIVFDSTDIDFADSLEEVISSITSALKEVTQSTEEQGCPLLPNKFYDTITNTRTSQVFDRYGDVFVSQP